VPGAAFTPRAESVDAYFAFGHVLAPHTIYEEVRKLEPGTALTLGPEGPPRTERFWRFAWRASPAASEGEWVERFRATFTATVRRHLISDVPLGAFLSGGVDSSAVVAAMSRASGEPVRTFTIGFDDPRVDETRFARRVAEHLGCRHTERRVELEEASCILPALARCYDEPFADPSAIPTWYVSRLAREQVTVALSGDGGDELFAGYERHLNERLLQRLGPLRVALGIASALPPLPGAAWSALRQRLRKIAADARLPSTFQRFFSKYQLAPRDVRLGLYAPGFAARLPQGDELARLAEETFPQPVSSDPLENLLYADTVVRLPDDILARGAGAVSGPHVRRVRGRSARGPQAARDHRQVPGPPRGRGLASARRPRPPQAGLRGAAVALGARRPRPHRRVAVARFGRGSRRLPRPGRGRGALRRAPRGARRPLAAPLRARHVRAVVGGATSQRLAARSVTANAAAPGRAVLTASIPFVNVLHRCGPCLPVSPSSASLWS
jgi:hypothetical protein